MIYHLALTKDWERALEKGWYQPAAEPAVRCFSDLQSLDLHTSQLPEAQQEAILLHIVEKRVKKQALITEGMPEGMVRFEDKIGIESVDRTDMLFRKEDGTWVMA